MTIKVVRGNPTPEELAAALAVVHARAAAAATVLEGPERLNQWADRKHNILRDSLTQPGPTTWRTSYWPH
ncbi:MULTISPECIES: acyl-CoA carboxylase epsilon subunit [Streptomyces]|uniref:Acyl-CoA carboxylase epsilon subunit n=1 Tax=Streptomyces caniscabiei TaxID=2746961 RepID=A0ABU4N5S7_9ACTN|nr:MULTISPECIES: acyl-CoA carboxylase epsilon subunit [Streptomyces]MBE4742020.1 acyl-CoA carboxylase subunit epsilon [Streptomyces caniscabiei]MBE4762787.1 acyl-CoA carboxylase subunit epsilon [Streptomyces caniscabiei]MBE4776050.1 acyl-CoA carboxylase subunit epsilon [Streptomyces caniscabiei]MBE4790840.1 acyl-CoA carboxylase subunit epsilon [Streptomyces caniscabiei]MBE4800031.1 acyl-CoA carboxylase subunit epsilon [Streptomyces caniscabiei]